MNAKPAAMSRAAALEELTEELLGSYLGDERGRRISHGYLPSREGIVEILTTVLEVPGMKMPEQAPGPEQVVEAARASKQFDECFLDHVLRQGAVAAQPKCETQQIRPQRLKQRLNPGPAWISANLILHG